jgi:hypothetical protein
MLGKLLAKRSPVFLLSVLLWLAVVGGGFFILWKYENTASGATTPPARWPIKSAIQRDFNKPTLVMLAHPRCPCTRASLGELARLMAVSQNKVTVYVLFFKPAEFSADWEKTDLWYSAERIPGVVVLSDENGAEAKRFQATTSGQVVLYNAEGQLRFNGGITASRGHAGDNTGRDTIVSLLTNHATERQETLAFGCSLIKKDSECNEEEKVCNK